MLMKEDVDMFGYEREKRGGGRSRSDDMKRAKCVAEQNM